jgi:hypothetical protein
MTYSFTARNGQIIEVPEDHISGYGLDDVGYCVECGAERYPTEPDVRRYKCDACGANSVYGAEEILISGAIS